MTTTFYIAITPLSGHTPYSAVRAAGGSGRVTTLGDEAHTLGTVVTGGELPALAHPYRRCR